MKSEIQMKKISLFKQCASLLLPSYLEACSMIFLPYDAVLIFTNSTKLLSSYVSPSIKAAGMSLFGKIQNILWVSCLQYIISASKSPPFLDIQQHFHYQGISFPPNFPFWTFSLKAMENIANQP